jgi:6-phosphogluconolactonase
VGKCELRKFDSAEELAGVAAGEWVAESASRNGDYFVAFSGGRIARTFCRELTRVNDSTIQRFNDLTVQSPLQCIHFFWADERCVPRIDPESNYRLLSEELLLPAKIPAERIHRIRGEEAPSIAAVLAEEEMRRIVPLNSDGWPELDMIFLGMGEDGHVASLFPPVEQRDGRAIYVAVTASKPPPNRISITYDVIVAAKKVWVLASGEGKAEALRESLRGDGKTPLAEVIRRRNVTNLLTDCTI